MCHCANVLFIAEIRNTFLKCKTALREFLVCAGADLIDLLAQQARGAVSYATVVKTKTRNQ